MSDTLLQNDEAPAGYKVEFLCTVQGCPRAVPGNGLATEAGRIAHQRTHKDAGSAPEQIISNDPELTAAEKKLATELQGAMVGPTLLLLMANPTDGMIVMKGSPKLIAALILCARKSKQLKAMLVFMTEATAWVQLGTAVAAIVCPILDNHHIVSIPTLTVADVLGGEAPVVTPNVRVPARSAPAPRPMPGNSTPVPNRAADQMGPLISVSGVVSNAAVPDPVTGLNRAARRAAEGGGWATCRRASRR